MSNKDLSHCGNRGRARIGDATARVDWSRIPNGVSKVKVAQNLKSDLSTLTHCDFLTVALNKSKDITL